MDSPRPVLHSCMYDRTHCAARGFQGGGSGQVGELFCSNGTRPHPKGKYELLPGESVTLRLPGGGGYFPAVERDPAAVLEDVRQERVTLKAAREQYGVVIDSDRWMVDEPATRKLRAAM